MYNITLFGHLTGQLFHLFSVIEVSMVKFRILRGKLNFKAMCFHLLKKKSKKKKSHFIRKSSQWHLEDPHLLCCRFYFRMSQVPQYHFKIN